MKTIQALSLALITTVLAGCHQTALLGPTTTQDPYSGCNTCDDSYHKPATAWKVVDGQHLAKFTIEELGFTTNPTFLEIKTKAESLGLLLGSASLAADLRAQYTDQPEGEYLLLMTAADANGNFQMYHIGHYPTVPPAPPSAPWISNGPENLNNQYSYDGAPAFYKHQLVFVVK